MSIRLLVTGASGFVGSSICNYFKLIYPVLGISRMPPPLSDIQYACLSSLLSSKSSSIISTFKPTHLVHCAAVAHRPFLFSRSELDCLYSVNVELTLMLARICDNSSIIHFIFISSAGVYGSSSLPGIPITEDSPLRPFNPYTRSKLEAERALFDHFAYSSTVLTVLRPPLIYGTDMPGNLPRLVRLICSGVPLPLKDIHSSRSFISITNLLSSLELLIEARSPISGVFILSDPFSFCIQQILSTISEVHSVPLRLFWMPSPLLRICESIPIFGRALVSLTSNFLIDSSGFSASYGHIPNPSGPQYFFSSLRQTHLG